MANTVTVLRENSAIHSLFNIKQDREFTQLFSEIVSQVNAYGYSERQAKFFCTDIVLCL